MNDSTMPVKLMIVILLVNCFFAVSSLAEEEENNKKQEGLSAGPGVVIFDKPYEGMGTETQVFPYISYQVQNFFVRGTSVGYRLYDNEGLAFDVLAGWRFNGYEEDDSRYLDGMDDRDKTLELGGAVTYDDGFGVTRFTFFNDVLGRHDGHVLELSYGKMFNPKGLAIKPSVGLSWQSENFVDYYYGVRSKESLPTRPRYDASETLNAFMSLHFAYRIDESWNVFTGFKYEFLDDEITESPIVDQHHQISWMFGFSYDF